MTALNTYLRDIQKRIDQELDRLIPRADVAPKRLHEAMRYSVFSGGKRIRPALCLATCKTFSGSYTEALVPACAIEALHTYTLIHDDLPAMDNDDMRRGKPTSHKKFDEATAILAGDALLTLAFELLGQHGDARLVTELAHATGSVGVIGGQQHDMQYKDTMPNAEELFAMHQLKTANLISVSCVMGALCAQASASDIEHMRVFGNNLGRAFQLLDDICDNDPITMSVIGREKTIQYAEDYKKTSYESLAVFSCDTKALRDIVDVVYSSFLYE